MHLCHKSFAGIANSIDPDQTASLGAVRSATALFAHTILLEILLYEIFGELLYILLLTLPPVSFSYLHLFKSGIAIS